MGLYDAEVRELRSNLAARLPHGFVFVNIGASDGVTGDPIYPFLDSHEPVGVLVEPVPYVMDRLRANYAGRPGIHFAPVAISEEPRSLWYVEEGSGSVEYVMRCLASFSREQVLASLAGLRTLGDHVSREAAVPADAPSAVREQAHEGPLITDDVESYVRELPVECVSVPELLDRYGIDHIDFLNVDVEGFDDEVLAALDWERCAPTVVCVELEGLPAERAAAARAAMADRGYVVVQRFGLFSEVFVAPEA